MFRTCLVAASILILAWAVSPVLAQGRPEIVWTSSDHASAVRSVAFSPDGQTLASGGDITINLWRASDGQLLRTLTGHAYEVYSVAFSSDGQTLASASGDQTIKLWRISDGQLLRTLTGHNTTVLSVAFSHDGLTLASGSSSVFHPETPRPGMIKLWWASDGQLLRTRTAAGSVFSVAFSPDDQTLASASGYRIELWRASDGQLMRTLSGHGNNYVRSVAFLPDGQTLASASQDRTIKLWRVSDGQLLRTLTGHTHDVLGHGLSPDGMTLVSGAGIFEDCTIRFWRVSSGQPLRIYDQETGTGVMCIQFSPDGQLFAYGRWDSMLVMARAPSFLLPGDIDGDCDVDLADLATMLSNFGLSSNATYAHGDLDGDGDVDLSDLSGLLANFGMTCP